MTTPSTENGNILNQVLFLNTLYILILLNLAVNLYSMIMNVSLFIFKIAFIHYLWFWLSTFNIYYKCITMWESFLWFTYPLDRDRTYKCITMRKNFLWFTHPALVKLLPLQLKTFLLFHQVGWTISYQLSKEIFEKLIKYDGQLWRGNAQSELYNNIPLRPQKAASNSWLNRIKCFIVTKYWHKYELYRFSNSGNSAPLSAKWK